MADRYSNGNGLRRAVLYLRMSSKKQDASIPAQRAELLAYAEQEGYVIVGEYVDEGVAGWKSEERREFRRLIEDAEAGKFDVILVWDQDRFSRFPVLEANHYWYLLDRAGVELVSLAQGKLDFEDLGEWLKASVVQHGKAEYCRDLSRNVARGLLAAARDGRSGTGGTSPQGLRNDPDRAMIVRRIFSLYLEPGASLRSVANRLNEEGILSPKGNPWSITTIRYVLRNRKYCGDYVRFRYRVGEYHTIRDGQVVERRRSDPRWEEAEPIVVEDHHEPIIDRETFEAAQRKLARQQKDTAPKGGNRYLFSGLLVCGDCNKVMGGFPVRKKTKRYLAYRCHTYCDGGRGACFSNRVSEPPLAEVVVRLLEREYLGEKALGRLRRKIEAKLAKRKTARRDLDQLRKRLADLDAKIERGAERVLNAPDRIVPDLLRRLDEVRSRRDRLQAELDAQERPESGSQRDQDKTVDQAIEVLRGIRGALSKAKPEHGRELIRSLVSRVEVYFSHSSTPKRTQSRFEYGRIFVRPDVAGSSPLFATLGCSEQDWTPVIRFTATDLKRAR